MTAILKIIGGLLAAAIVSSAQAGAEWYVSPQGNDQNPGTRTRPFLTVDRALLEVARVGDVAPRTVYLRAGTHYLPKTLVLSSALAATERSPVTIQGVRGEEAVVSGGERLHLTWTPFRDGIYRATVPDGRGFDELFVNGQRQIMARYPNFDPTVRVFNGFAADAIAPDRVKRWKDPTGGFFHAMHPNEWGDYTWRILGKRSEGELEMEGGWQNNRPAGPHNVHRFVENIFEELDAPNEWFFDRGSRTLYYFPPVGLDLTSAKIETARLSVLVKFQGTAEKPVAYVRMKDLTFRHAARTVMETKEPLLRSDWAICRKGALLFEGASHCEVERCFLDEVGGNAVFVSNFNRNLAFRSLHIAKAGAGGIQFVGDPAAARSALFNYDQTQPLERIDLTPGPKSNNYPRDCIVENCLIYLTGRTEKQTAGINIDLAQSITVRHCSIYDMPRAGINIGDGCWGGHVIEGCDVFDTVKETGDHGSFNSWGRDRFWNPDIDITNGWVAKHPTMPFLDVVRPIVLRNNRWRCDHGWDIDLDDGSSNYEIYNNLCLNGGIKNREGYRRKVTNNVLVANGYHPHVWYKDSQDEFRHNIVWQNYAPARMYAKPWPKELDENFLQLTGGTGDVQPAKSLQEMSGQDSRSLAGDAKFLNPAKGDYRVARNSPALKAGFRNFPMDRFGVQDPKLRKLARVPWFSAPGADPAVSSQTKEVVWGPLTVREIRSIQEASAYGTSPNVGVLVVARSNARFPLRPGDVILQIESQSIRTPSDLPAWAPAPSLRIVYLRDQQRREITVKG